MNTLWIVLFALYFAGLWTGILYLSAWLGGWRALASKFRVPAMPEGKTRRFQTVSLTRVPGLPASYGFCTILTITPAGLGMAVPSLFRFGHPPLLIPWTEFYAMQPRSVFFFKTVDAEIGSPRIATVQLPAWVFEQANQAMEE